MKKLVSILAVIGISGLCFAQSLIVSPAEITKEVAFGRDASSAVIGVGATSSVSGISVSSSASWLSVSPASFDLTNILFTNITLTFDTDALAIGDYEAEVYVVQGGTTNTVTIALRMYEPKEWGIKHPFIMFNVKKTAVDPTLVKPRMAGDILIYTTSNIVYISKGLTTNDWIQLAP